MIIRNFNNFKFFRTYIGGSKKDEKKLFFNVQGTENDNSDCDWLEFRKMLIIYWDDILNVLITWEYFTKKISIGLLILSIALFNFKYISLIIFITSLLTALINHIIKKRKIDAANNYDFTLSITQNQIKEKYGFNFYN